MNCIKCLRPQSVLCPCSSLSSLGAQSQITSLTWYMHGFSKRDTDPGYRKQLMLPLQGTPVSNGTKLLSPETRVTVLCKFLNSASEVIRHAGAIQIRLLLLLLLLLSGSHNMQTHDMSIPRQTYMQNDHSRSSILVQMKLHKGNTYWNTIIVALYVKDRYSA